MHEFKIDDNIPMPVHMRGYRKYPFYELVVGQSFFVPGRNATQLSSAARGCKKKFGREFTAESVVENNVSGARIWRTK
jgi:hypothetical protein